MFPPTPKQNKVLGVWSGAPQGPEIEGRHDNGSFIRPISNLVVMESPYSFLVASGRIVKWAFKKQRIFPPDPSVMKSSKQFTVLFTSLKRNSG